MVTECQSVPSLIKRAVLSGSTLLNQAGVAVNTSIFFLLLFVFLEFIILLTTTLHSVLCFYLFTFCF